MKVRILVSLAIVAVISIGVISEGAQSNLAGKYDQSLRKGEARATLDPDMFRESNIRRAYQIAKEIPWVLDSIIAIASVPNRLFSGIGSVELLR